MFFYVGGAGAARCRLTGTQGCVRYRPVIMLYLTSAVHEQQNAALTGTGGCVRDTDVRCAFIQAHSADSVTVVNDKRSTA